MTPAVRLLDRVTMGDESHGALIEGLGASLNQSWRFWLELYTVL